MGRFFSYLMLTSVKYLSSVFYRYDVNWLNTSKNNVDWDNIRLIVFLNHTSLYEPIFVRVAPNRFLWQISRNLVVPGADITMNRPLVGRFFKFLLPGLVSITRKKDFSWRYFLEKISPKSIVAILPEGRMKRKDGLDKHGKPMTVRGGIADILEGLDHGKALFVYSGGLHHIQAPGDKLPKLFKKVKVNLELLPISSYKKSLINSPLCNFKRNLMEDLNKRLNTLIPKE